MILGIMQPYFFPYLGHYQLILATDQWVVFDLVRYSRKSWMNRNRILHPTAGWQYVNVPIKGSHDQRLDVVALADPEAARRRVLGQIDHYRGKAPYFGRVHGLVEEAFAGAGTDKLCDLNIRSLAVVCDYLDIPFDYRVGSELDIDLSNVEHAGQWALEISAALGAKRYVNPPGGRDIFRRQEWVDRDIELRFIDPAPMVYETRGYAYESNLSVLDVLMWNDPRTIRHHLDTTINITI